MAINLLGLQPHKVSRDLSGYITYIYGRPKTGKTTLAVQAPGALLLAFERGYNALPGVIAQDITSWAEMKQVVRELKKPEVREAYKTLIVHTVDIAADCCQKYICNQLGIDNIGDGGWTNNGWAKYKKEFEDVFRSLTQMGYAVIFISHAKEKSCKRKDGTEYTQITPSLQTSANSIVENMADIYAYAHPERIDGMPKVVLTMRHEDDTIFCGGRFKYIDSQIDFNYDSLVKALNDAIDREEQAIKNPSLFTEKREEIIEAPDYDYEALMKEFNGYVVDLMAKDKAFYSPRITAIVEKYLGKGKKVSETTISQAEFIHLINSEIKEDLLKV
jgi:hypothetical protein